MYKFENFKLNQGFDHYQNVIFLKKFIDSFSKDKKTNNYFSDLEIIFRIPKFSLIKKVNQIIFRCFNFYSGKFTLKNSYIQILLNFIEFNIFFFVNLFFFFKKKEKKYEIILCNIDSDSFDRYKNILKQFQKIAIITKNYLEYVKIKESFPKKKIHFYSRNSFGFNYSLKSILKVYKVFFHIFCFSITRKQNFIKIFIILLRSILSASKLSDIVSSDKLLYTRIYWTCPIINFFFKKKQKTKIFLIQSHLYDPTFGIYLDTDFYFSWCKNFEQKNELEHYGSRIEEILPVGSIFAEERLIKKKKKIDLLIIFSSFSTWYHFPKVKESFNKYICWIDKIIKKFKNYHVVISPHPSDLKTYSLAKKFFEKYPNVELLNMEDSCYRYISSSSIILSYSSSVVLESYLLNKKAYFIQPAIGLTGIFKKKKYLHKIIIRDYKTLEKKILEKEKVLKKYLIYLKKKNISSRIYKYIQRK